MSKITEMLISAIIKKGILYEARDCDINVDLPIANQNEKIKIIFKAQHMTLKIIKSDKDTDHYKSLT